MKRKYMLSFSESTSDRPIIHDLIKRFDVCINIIKAEVSPGLTGSMLAERIVDVFLNTEFEAGRHARRVGLMMDIETD